MLVIQALTGQLVQVELLVAVVRQETQALQVILVQLVIRALMVLLVLEAQVVRQA